MHCPVQHVENTRAHGTHRTNSCHTESAKDAQPKNHIPTATVFGMSQSTPAWRQVQRRLWVAVQLLNLLWREALCLSLLGVLRRQALCLSLLGILAISCNLLPRRRVCKLPLLLPNARVHAAGVWPAAVPGWLASAGRLPHCRSCASQLHTIFLQCLQPVTRCFSAEARTGKEQYACLARR